MLDCLHVCTGLAHTGSLEQAVFLQRSFSQEASRCEFNSVLVLYGSVFVETYLLQLSTEKILSEVIEGNEEV